jgi:16S rRNA (guanine(527)-N(7))-methyltransferase RsmG
MSVHNGGNHRTDSACGESGSLGGDGAHPRDFESGVQGGSGGEPDTKPSGDEGEPEAGEKSATSDSPGEVKKSRREEDPDAVLQFADLAVPSVDELRDALAWAFSTEEVAPELLDRFAAHAKLVLDGNRVMNLTAIVDPKEVAAKHYLDSWRTTRLLSLLGRNVLDLGTGAGFPGMPIAIAEPQARVCMVDSTQKRIDFVARCIAQLGLRNATAVAARAEEHLARNKYDIVLMRAVSSVRENVRLLRKVRHSRIS